MSINIFVLENKSTRTLQQVYLNLKEVAQFEYRQPLSAINHIFIDGSIELHEVNWGGKYYVNIHPVLLNNIINVKWKSAPLKPVPYQAGIDGGFTPGKKLIVCGVPEKKVDNFKIDFLTAEGQIAFHFNPRFGKKVLTAFKIEKFRLFDQVSKQKFRSSSETPTWTARGATRRARASSRFRPTSPLTFRSSTSPMLSRYHIYKTGGGVIRIFRNCWKNRICFRIQVFVNGAHFCAFAHRIEPTSIKGLRIEGDVELHGVHVKWKNPG